VCEESPNDGAKWWLTDGEWAVVAYLGDGENGEKEEASAGVFLFIVGREREEVIPVPHVSIERPTACRSSGNAM
jgi:alkylation response protein AidB-like acyl-CoA dehydrogenase